MENPEWVNKLLQLIEEVKSEEEKQKQEEQPPIPKEKIILSTKEEGLLWFEMLKTLSTTKTKNGIIRFPDYF
jgi:hypothetical protein